LTTSDALDGVLRVGHCTGNIPVADFFGAGMALIYGSWSGVFFLFSWVGLGEREEWKVKMAVWI
jgi:hypothetical protein